MFVGKARSLTKSGTHEREGSCITCEYYIRLERLARDKHSSLIGTFLNYIL